jgi:hypothetical protein
VRGNPRMRRSLIRAALAGVAALALAAPGAARAATTSSPWHADTVPLPTGATSGWLHGVSCLSATNCVAAGNYSNGAEYFPLAEAWDGSAWTAQRPPVPPGASSSFLQAISCHPGGRHPVRRGRAAGRAQGQRLTVPAPAARDRGRCARYPAYLRPSLLTAGR